jgi:thiosulfate dehydrogenase (quinone) large subunit
MSQTSHVMTTRKGEILQDPPFVQKILADRRAGWFWFVLRIWLGWQWLSASMHKITNPAWVGGGAALKGFWTNAIAIPESGNPAIHYAWYRGFLTFMLNAHAYTWFAKLIAYGEFLIGIGLILGAFTGIAAFFSGLMNWNFMMAGSASSNPMLFVIAVGLILAWKVAGYVGADYFLLSWLGTPWKTVNQETLQEAGGISSAPSSRPISGD